MSATTNQTVIGRYPAFGIFIMLLIALFADYLCLDLRYFRRLAFSSGISANSPWYWPVFAAFLVLTLYCFRQLAFPKVLLRADVSGIRFAHRALRPALRVAWPEVKGITRGQLEMREGGQLQITPGIRFYVRTS